MMEAQMRKGLVALFFVSTLLFTSVSIGADQNSYKPKQGYVPDEQTAIVIAVAVWIPLYGREQIENEKPYRASLKDGVWTVRGTLHKGFKGGTAEAKISKDSGCILEVIHYK
jgi:hypothetical protein